LLSFCCLNTKGQTRDSTVDIYSRVSCYVQAFKGDHRLWNGTGFFFNTKGKLYFITNNHVVGGKFYIDEYIQGHGYPPTADLFPDNIIIRVYGKILNDTVNIRIPLIIDNKLAYINFNNSSILNDLMDVVAIPIPQNIVAPANIDLIYLSSIDLQPDLVLYPSYDLFIVGFPFDFARYSVYPLWKKGTIASEPTLINSNKFLIDATARGGMSGSSVYFRGTTFIANHTQFMGGGVRTFLIGIYSAQNVNAEIGVVWKLSKVINELNQLNQ
jgi:hypothetical protein